MSRSPAQWTLRPDHPFRAEFSVRLEPLPAHGGRERRRAARCCRGGVGAGRIRRSRASYHHLWNAPLHERARRACAKRPSLHFLVHEGLMTIYLFLVVGMEIRREMHDGALASTNSRRSPLVAAARWRRGPRHPLHRCLEFRAERAQRLAVPTATDIAVRGRHTRIARQIDCRPRCGFFCSRSRSSTTLPP